MSTSDFSIKDYYASLALSIPAHNDSRYHVIGDCLMLASNPRWGEVRLIGGIFDTQAEESWGGAEPLRNLARLTFRAQPTRRHLLGICVFAHSSRAEVWIFDRVGSARLESFGNGHFGEGVDSKLTGFTRMSLHDLGMDTFVQSDDEGRYVLTSQLENGPVGKFYVHPEPIHLRSHQVADGAVFVWRSEKTDPEEQLLAKVAEKNIQGVVRLKGFKNLDNVASFRRALGYEVANPTGFVNSFFSCIVTAPYGRPLQEFRTVMELLRALRDAIIAHRSLYLNANVLHQDVSPGNIVITDGEGPKGTLIDLGFAVELDRLPDRKGFITGTKEFIAIGVLRKETHSYRHDLESFFYVFLWIAICYRHDSPPRRIPLQDWGRGRWSDMAHAKAYHMRPQKFEEILEFHPRFEELKQLARDLREALFGSDEVPFIGTDMSPEGTAKLYEDMVGAVNRAL